MKGIRAITTIVIGTVLSLIMGNQAVFAEGDLSISISSDTASMSVAPGIFTSTSQTIAASTTNSGGYTVKMDTTGPSSSLINTSDNSYSIPTFTLPSGSPSLPANSTGYGYGYSTDGGSNYLPIIEPTDPSVRLFATAVSGANTHTLTFGTMAPFDVSPGTYTNEVAIYIVANVVPCPVNSICYDGNGDDGTGAMGNQQASSNANVTLIPSNFSRSGYGFAGWNTSADGTGTNYGPSQTITTGDLSLVGMQLYARWVQSSGNLQGWNGCDSLSEGSIIALTDTRDGNTYAVAKYADGRCWTMENLRLDLSKSGLEISALNTNNPTQSFINTINQNHPASTNDFCTANDAACINQVLHNTNNTNRNLTASYNTNNTSSSWYSYGNYYNWYTATVGYGTYGMSTAGAAVEGDLCPAGWKLPTGYGNTGDLSKLDVAMGGNGRNATSESATGSVASTRWRAYPYNFIYGGEQRGATAGNRNISSSYATQNAASSDRTNNLWLKTDGVYMDSNNTLKVRGQTIRCIAKKEYVETGNIHYDANGGTGTMSDDIDVNFGTAVAADNQYTRHRATFVGWNTSANGNGVVVPAGGSVAAAASYMGVTTGETLTLYAIWQLQYSLLYDGNGADNGSMASAAVSSLEAGQLTLVASNFQRDGYGFAGWSLDSAAATKLANGQQVTIYGPNETISINSTFLANADPATNEITLYAVWIPEDTTYTMQSFGTNECNALNVGSVMALKDSRDNNTYMIAKLADNHCWMSENLRLNPAVIALDDTNTNRPTSSFSTEAASSSTANTLCNDDDSTCVDHVKFNSNALNRSYTASYDKNLVESSWYSYGVMYNWYTATAGNGNFDMMSGNVAGDICPAGWRLPTGGATSEFNTLNTAINNGYTSVDTGLRKFPANFNYSGDYNYDKPGGRHTYGRYWSATPQSKEKAYRFGIASTGPTPAKTWNKWDAFAVRCIVK